MVQDFIESPSLSFSFKIDDKDWEKICSKLDNVEHCDFCKYHNDCYGISCYGGEPIEPPCACQTASEYIDNEKFYEMYIKGIWEKEEEKDMNKVLKLWNDRKVEEIELKYNDLMNEYIEKHYETTKKYKDLIEKFEKDLETLYKEEIENKESESSILKENNTCNVYKYVVCEDKLRNEAYKKYREDKIKESDEQVDKCNEIDALLSMSEDLEYQQSVLIEYGIIDKKTKRMI